MLPRPPNNSRRLALVVAAIAVPAVARFLATGFMPLLLRDQPLLLIALDPATRHVLLVAAKLDLAPFMVVCVLRRVATDPLFFLIGRWYGDRAVAWVRRRAARGAGTVERAERLFRRASWLVVLVSPGALVSTLAGASGMRARTFLALDVCGTLGVVVALRLIAGVAAGPLSAVAGFIDRHAPWLTATCLLVSTLGLLAHQWRRGTPATGGSPVTLTE